MGLVLPTPLLCLTRLLTRMNLANKVSQAGGTLLTMMATIQPQLTSSHSLGVMLGVYTAGKSGAHLNPAVTLANCIYRKFPWRKFPIYAFAQTFGAFCAAGVVYGNYKSAIDAFEGGPGIRTVPGYSNHSSAGIFCTYPAPFMTKTGQFFSEFIASSILMFMIYALKDDGNIGAGDMVPLGLFFVIFGIGMYSHRRCFLGAGC
jgi:glycerol uptake facilitator-like aquaporin